MGAARVARWAPLTFAVLFLGTLLLQAGTSPLDLLRYAAYAVLAVMLPGTLVYRVLRRQPHSLVEDLSMGLAVGLALEIAAWALVSVADLRGLAWLWPALVVVPFATVKRLRRHWRPTFTASAPLAWSWCVVGVVCFFATYLAMVFIDRNPILPTSDGTLQYVDLAYQLSLAGDAKGHLPVGLPQVAGEPLYYHWFAYTHAAMTSLVGHIDLPVVMLRLVVPGLSALAALLTAVVGWRVSGRPFAGVAAAVLFFVVGEFSFIRPVTFPFGTQATFVVWHGMSMIYSWVLLLALIIPLVAIVRSQRAPGLFVLAGLLLFASSGAKASSVPVVALALLLVAGARLIADRAVPWGIVMAGVIAGAAQLFGLAVLFRFQTYGLVFGPLQGLAYYWVDTGSVWVRIAVAIAFVLNMQLRLAGIVALLRDRVARLDPGVWLLLAGAVAGLGIYFLFRQDAGGNQYFVRAGFTFGVLASGWGYALAVERARLTAGGKLALALAGVAFSVVLVRVQLAYAGPPQGAAAFSAVEPIVRWGGLLAAVAVLLGLTWYGLGQRWRRMRGRGGLVLLTAILLAGMPGLILDEDKSLAAPNGGAYSVIALPQSRVEAARFVRDNSSPDDTIATNVHCLSGSGPQCDARVFWLSAYAERRVLVEGWGFAPRQAATGYGPFWDRDRLALNDAAFTQPTPEILATLRERYGVRWLVADRESGPVSPRLAALAATRFTNRRVTVYEL